MSMHAALILWDNFFTDSTTEIHDWKLFFIFQASEANLRKVYNAYTPEI